MKGLTHKAHWLGTLAAAGALLLTGTGAAAAAPAAPEPTVRQSAAPGTVALGGHLEQLTVTTDGARGYAVVSYAGPRGGMVRVVRSLDVRTGATADLLTLTGFDIVSRPAVSPDGTRVYLTVGGDLVTIDTATGRETARVAAPDQPRPEGFTAGVLHGVTVSADGTRVYIDQYGSWGRRASQAGRVLAYDTASRTFTGAAELTGYVVDRVVLGPDGTDAWVGTQDGLYHLDVRGAAPAVIDTVAGFGAGDEVAPAPDGRAVYARGHQDATGTVDTVDPAANTYRPAFTAAPSWDDAHLLGVSPDSRRVYVLTDGKTPRAALRAYDTATNTAVPGHTVTHFGLPSATDASLGQDGHTLYLTSGTGVDSVLKTVRF